MTNQILDQIIRANPRPPDAQVPEGVLGSAALLVELDKRSGDMQTQETPIRIELAPEKTRAWSPRRMAPALAGLAAVIVVVVVAAVFLTGGDESRSQYADAAAGGDPLAVAGLFADSFRVGDVDTVLEYLHPDFTPPGLPADAIEAVSAWIDFEGALYGRDEPGSSSCEGPINVGWYFCTYTEPADGVLASVGRLEVTWAAQVADGLVRTFEKPGSMVGDSTITNNIEDNVEAPLGEFAADVDPEGSAAVCDVLGAVQADANLYRVGVGTIYNQECGEFLAGFVDDYAASLE